MTKFNKKELGDYQTPLSFAEMICQYLKNDLNISPDTIIEPTCGCGNFLKSASETFTAGKMYGIEIDPEKLKQIDKNIPHLKLFNEDIFTFEFDKIKHGSSYLIIGNPPWVTNTELSKINSSNLPEKSNFKNESNIDALMGNSNFDISESITLKIIEEFKDIQTTIAFLCKTSVSRNVFREMKRRNITYSFIRQLNFNSEKIFKIDADACLLVLQFGKNTLKNRKCEVCDLFNPDEVLYTFGYKSDKFYSNFNDIPDIDGECAVEWRQGVKHDCSNVMELTLKGSKLFNKNGAEVLIEDDLVYPLLKSSDLKKPIITKSARRIIIPQKKTKQKTDYIKTQAPKTWEYLNRNKHYFDKRKSTIYENAPDFSIFGIGDYSFRKYKVAISGFYKNPKFCLVHAEKAMMLDDTCYFLSFDDYDSAYITMLILNTQLVKSFLKNIVFLDSKRPYSKKVLKRIDLGKCLKLLSFDKLKECENELELAGYITPEKFIKFNNIYKY